MSAAATCARCGVPSAQAHHLTGRPASTAPYLDPHLTLPLCAACHGLMHQLWRLLGLSAGEPDTLRLLRTAALLGLLADRASPLPAATCGPLGLMLSDVAARLVRP